MIDSPGEAIRRAREAKRLTQAELATRVGTRQQTIEKIEKGKIIHSRYLRKIALELALPLETIDPGYGASAPHNFIIPETQLRSGDRDFPVHTATEGGPGEIVVSSDPVSWVLRPTPLLGVSRAYGIIVIGESMIPEFRSGDTALVNPHVPPERDETYVFYSLERHGEVRASIKHLIRWTETTWHVRQWNPPKGHKADFTLSRVEWPKAHRVVGKYSK